MQGWKFQRNKTLRSRAAFTAGQLFSLRGCCAQRALPFVSALLSPP